MEEAALKKTLASLKNDVEILKKQFKLITTELNKVKREISNE